MVNQERIVEVEEEYGELVAKVFNRRIGTFEKAPKNWRHLLQIDICAHSGDTEGCETVFAPVSKHAWFGVREACDIYKILCMFNKIPVDEKMAKNLEIAQNVAERRENMISFLEDEVHKSDVECAMLQKRLHKALKENKVFKWFTVILVCAVWVNILIRLFS